MSFIDSWLLRLCSLTSLDKQRLWFEIIRVVFGDISNALTSLSQVLLQYQVVYSRYRVVTVVYNVLFGLLVFTGLVTRFVVVDFTNDLHIYWYRVLTNVDAMILFNLGLLIPRVTSDSLDIKPFLWVCAQNLPYQVLTRITDKFWDLILSIENLMVKFVGLGVLERQEATNHCIYDNSTTPHISRETIIFLTGNHLWGCIARTSTGSLEQLPWLVSITETKINNLDVIEVVHQQVFRFQISMADAELMKVVHSRQDLM